MDSTFILQRYMIYLPAKFHSEVPFSLEIGPFLARIQLAFADRGPQGTEQKVRC